MADETVASEGSSDTPEPSLRETLEAAFKEHSEPEPPETATETPDRARDESGRFAAKDVKDTPEPRAQPNEATSQTPVVTPTPENVTLSATEPAPNSWTAAAKAKWTELPAEIRAEIGKREKDIHRQFSTNDEERTFAREMQRVVGPYEPMIRAAGARVPDAVASVLNTAYVLRTADPVTKAREIANVCQQYGVDLSLVAQPPPQNPEVADTRQRLMQLENLLQQQQRETQQAQESHVLNELGAFSQDPKHAHFPAVRAHMGALLQAGAAKDLEDAYQQAIWANPEVRSQLLAAQAAQQSSAQKQVQTVQRARTRAVSVRGGPGGTPPAAPNPNASVREDLMAAMDEVRGRV